MASEFPNIDFEFRIGYKEQFKNTPYKEGSLNFIKDTGELFVDKDNLRFPITSIVFDAGSEAQIRSLVSPENKLYLSNDTFRLLFFDRSKLEWKIVGSDDVSVANVANSAIHDSLGNDISTYYYPKRDAIIEHENFAKELTAIKTSVGSIIRFDVKVLNSIGSLPEEGEKGIIYCVPVSDCSDYTDSIYNSDEYENIMDNYIELLWVSDTIYGGYFEVVGSTHINMSDHYTKSEVESLIDALREEMLSIISAEKTELLNSINTIRSTVNSIESSNNNKMSSLTSTVSDLSGKVNINANNISNLKETDTEIKQAVSDNSGDISKLTSKLEELTTAVSNMNNELSNRITENANAIQSEKAINESQSNTITTISGKVTDNTNSIGVNADDIDELEEKVAALEESTSENTANIELVNQTVENTVNNKLTEVNNNISGIEKDLADTNAEVASIKENITEIESDVKTNADNITTLQSSLNATNANISSVSEEVEANAAAIDAVETNVSNLTTTTNTNTQKLTTVTDQVTNLSNSISETDSELTEVKESYLRAELPNEG